MVSWQAFKKILCTKSGRLEPPPRSNFQKIQNDASPTPPQLPHIFPTDLPKTQHNQNPLYKENPQQVMGPILTSKENGEKNPELKPSLDPLDPPPSQPLSNR